MTDKPKKTALAEDGAAYAPAAGKTLKLRRIGNSVGVVLPKDLLAKLGAGEGDDLHVVETPDGLEIKRSDEEFEEHMRLVEDIMRRYPKTLKALAQ